MKKLFEKIKRYKKALLVLIATFVLVFIWVTLSKKAPKLIELTPVIVKEEEEVDTQPIVRGDFYLEKASPPSGEVQIMSSYTHLIFKFSKPVAKEGVVVSVKPQITLKKEWSQDGKTLFIYPRSEPWLDRTNYTITITNIKSREGDDLNTRNIVHQYFNDKPVPLDVGESAR
ncbi:MAG: hypothetical protein WC243_00305 [Patescibacteria group bacterium]